MIERRKSRAQLTKESDHWTREQFKQMECADVNVRDTTKWYYNE